MSDDPRLAEQAKADPSGQPPPDAAPPISSDVLAVAARGLGPRTESRKRVVIVGGGLAGLVCGFELKREGHDVVILEAQNRVGGRIYTLRSFAPGLYAEAGGMRIPRAHDLTLRYCDEFDLPLRPFVMGNPKGLVHIGGERMTAAEANANPTRLPFAVEEGERGRSADDLWESAISDLRRMVENEGDSAWEHIVREYDQYSLYEFLRMKGFSEGAIEYYAVMNFVEADMHNAVVEILREDLGKAYVDMQEIAGGMDLLPNAFYRELEKEVRLGAEAFAIDQDTVERHGALQDRGRTVQRGSRLRGHHRALLGPPIDRNGDALLTGQAARDPSAQLPRFDQSAVPGSRESLGDGRRDIWWRDRHRLAHPAHELSDARPNDRTRHAACLIHVGPGRPAMGGDG